MRISSILISVAVCLVITSCSPSPSNVTKTTDAVPMYPDYTDITIPVNIAPLNFLLRSDAKAVSLSVNGEQIASARGNELTFSESEWRDLLEQNQGKTLTVSVAAEYADGWREYRPFTWTVVSDKIDAYLTYRLIEPDYEVFNELVLQERCVENFDVKNFCDHNVVGNKCMNCHTYAGNDPQTSMFYVRGEGGGAILNSNGMLQKLNLKRSDWVSGSVYFGFSPSKRYVVFSTNKIIPAFHASAEKRLEVFDTMSDVYIADLQTNKFIESPLLADAAELETFPTFSPDGKYIYYCTASAIDSLDALRQTRYSLCRVGFDEQTGTIGTKVDTVYNARTMGKSVCHPRISPDGQWLVFTVADYGTFPIWHREADLMGRRLSPALPVGREQVTQGNRGDAQANGNYGQNKSDGMAMLMDLRRVNSPLSDTYHSWSSNSRWLVFASKRDDGLYGKPYFTYVDKKGVCSKPFVLPQAHPTYYDNCLKSFNAPELGTGPLPFSVNDVQRLLSAPPTEFR